MISVWVQLLCHKPFKLTGNEIRFIRLYFEMTLQFLKDSKVEKITAPTPETLLEHYLRTLNQPVPSLPSWIEPLLNQNAPELKKKMQASLKDPFRKREDPYLKWLIPNLDEIDIDQLIKDWYEKLKVIF